MIKKKVRIHLGGGVLVDHELEVADEAEYAQTVNDLVDSLKNYREGVLVFTSPTLGVYRYDGHIGVKFIEPPPPDKRPQMGFQRPSG